MHARCSVALPAVLLMAFAPAARGQAPAYQNELKKLLPDDLEAHDRFGIADMDGVTVVLGAWGGQKVYVYEDAGSGWTRTQVLSAADQTPSDHFGQSVAVEGDTLAVGAPGHDSGTGLGAGAVYVYRRSVGIWSLEEKLEPQVIETQANFGADVALSGDRLLVGAPYYDTSAPDSGAAFAFERTGSTWSALGRWDAPDPASQDLFGQRVALAGDLAIVAEPADQDLGDAAGALHVFTFGMAGGVWTDKLLASDGAAGDLLGGGLALQGERLVAGAWRSDAGAVDSGAAYVFEREAGTWFERAKLVAWDPTENELLGTRVALDGDRILVGCRQDDSAGIYSGSARLYERTSTGAWFEGAVLMSSDAGATREFGFEVALSGDTAVIGCAFDSSAGSAAGSAYVFRFPMLDGGSCFGDAGCPCANDAVPGGCANSAGRGALLAVGGSASVSDDDLLLGCFGFPSNTTCMLFAGNLAPGVPFGDGISCVTGPYARLGVRVGGPSSSAAWGPGLGALAGWVVGDSPAFQVWYRDPQGVPCGSYFNLSNTVDVLLVP